MPDEIHTNYVQERLYLPNEILAVIINLLATDQVNSNDKTVAALASCRLASRVLCSLATPLFFSSIYLTDISGPLKHRVTKLYTFLTIHDVASSVQTFTLWSHKENLQDLTSGTIISAILHRLPHIRDFTLKIREYFLDFFSLPWNFASAFQALCRSPNLITLDLENIQYFPITVIHTCPNLRQLRLSRVGCRFDARDLEETSSSKFLYLDSLEIDDDYVTHSLGSVISTHISFAKHFSRIKYLQVNNLFLSYKTLNDGWNIMFPALQSLTTLDLRRHTRRRTDSLDVFKVVPFNLGRFPALRDFKIQLRILLKDTMTTLNLLNQLLSIPSSTSGIETLEIKIIFLWDIVSKPAKHYLSSSDAGWSTLDKILTRGNLVSLKKVVLTLVLDMERGWDSGEEYQQSSELERNITLPYVNTLFPMFRASTSTQRTLEMHLKVI